MAPIASSNISAELAISGSYRSRQVTAAALVDLLDRAQLAGKYPCVRAVSAALAVLALPPKTGALLTSLSVDAFHLDIRRLLRHHPDVVRACVNFLCWAADTAQLPAAFTRKECTCDLPINSILRRFHDPSIVPFTVCDDPASRSVLTKRNGVLDALLCTLEPCTAHLLTTNFHHLFNAVGSRSRPWPDSGEETAQSLVMAHLVPKYPSEDLVSIVLHLLQLLPFPLRFQRALSDVIPHVLLPFLTRLAAQWKESSQDAVESEYYLDWLHRCTLVLEPPTLAGDRVLGPALQNHRDLYRKLMPALQEPMMVSWAAARQAGMPAPLPGVIEPPFMLLGFIGRVHKVLGISYIGDYYGVPAGRITQHLTMQFDPIARRLMAADELLKTNNVCAFPGCNVDYLCLGRGLKACSRCHHVFYCSSSCQEKAWRQPPSPHRKFCKELKAMADGGKVAVRYKRDRPLEALAGFYANFCGGRADEDLERLLEHIYLCYL